MTEAELERLDKEEQKETEKAILLILALYAGLWNKLESMTYELFGKYAEDGRLTLQNMRRSLDSSELKKFNSTYGSSYARLSRMNAFLHTLRREIYSLEDEYERILRELGRTIVGMETSAFDTSLDDIEDILITRWGADNLNFIERIAKSGDQLFAKLVLELKRRLAMGESVEDVLSELDKLIEIAKRAAKNSVVTEASAVSTNAQREIFKALGVTKYKYYALVDERMCEICGSLHGKTFLMSNFEIGVTAPPIHRSCRCRIEPVID